MWWGRDSESESKYPDDWNSRRRRVLQRDGHICQKCGKRGGNKGDAQLHAHHKTPISNGGSHKLSNLATVCHSCHEEIHGHRIPTKGQASKTNSRGASGSNSIIKKAVWMPSWESWGKPSDGTNIDAEIRWFNRESARSPEDWIARWFAVGILYFTISVWYFVYIGESVSILEALVGPIILAIVVGLSLLIPIIGIPLVIVSLLFIIAYTGVIWLILRAIFEKFLSLDDRDTSDISTEYDNNNPDIDSSNNSDSLKRKANHWSEKNEYPYDSYHEATNDIKKLKRERKHDEAEDLLLWCINYAESETTPNQRGHPRWYYKHLAIIYRKEDRYDDEVEILQRYVSFCEEMNIEPREEIVDRLERAKEISKSRAS